MLSYRFGNGWLLSDAKDLAGHAVFSFELLHDTYNKPLPCFSIYSRFLKQYRLGDMSAWKELLSPQEQDNAKTHSARAEELDPAARIDNEFDDGNILASPILSLFTIPIINAATWLCL